MISAHGGARAPFPGRECLGAATAAGLGFTLLKLLPELELGLFAAGAARLASLFTGQPVLRVENGWMLPAADLSTIVTTACSATDYFLMVAALVAWRLAALRWSFVAAVLGGVAGAVPFTLLVNSLRVVAVSQAHRWIIDRVPESYDAFLHMTTGVAIFLPSLILLNVLLTLRLTHRPSVSS